MKNCFLKQYKKRTNADLEVFGELLYEVPAAAAGRSDIAFPIGVIQDGVISIEGNLELWDYSKTTNYGSSFTNNSPAPNSGAVKVVVNGAGTIRISNKYNTKQGSNYGFEEAFPTKFGYDTKSISYWWVGKKFKCPNYTPKSKANPSPITGDIKELERSNNAFNEINIGYTYITGTLQDIAYYKNSLQNLTINGTYIGGSLEDLGECTNLTYLNKNNVALLTPITGTIEGFVARQRTAGRTTASNLTFDLTGNECTFNGNLIVSASENNLAWTASTITFNGETITA